MSSYHPASRSSRAIVKQPAWLIDLEDEVRTMFKPRGTVNSLTVTRDEEASLVESVELAVDSDPGRSGVLEELVAECRSRSVARPDEASWHFLHGRLLMAAGDPSEARDELEQAALLDPRDPRITAHLALWYEAALLAATGAQANVDLPGVAGLDLSADAFRFAHIDEPLTVDELAKRALKLFDQAMRFRLPRRDIQFLREHVEIVRDAASHEDVRVRRRQLLRAV
jgi:hypothetical protein